MAIETGDTGDGGEVTFVNGQAIEQTTEGETHEGTDRGDELEAAKAAVKKAIEEDAKEEGKKAAKEAKAHKDKDPLVPRDRNADGTFVQQDPVEADKEAAVKALKKEADEEASALRKALEGKREAAKMKREASEALEKERAEVRRVYAQVQQKEREVAAEKERIARYRANPAQLAREAGYANPEDYILELAQEGTPEGARRREERALLERLERAENWQKEQVANAQRQAQEADRHAKLQHRQNVESQFLAAASKHESLVDMYKGHEIELIGQADIIAEKYRAATGQEATFEELAEYIAERHEKWYKNRMSKNGASAGTGQGSPQRAAATVSAGSPTQGSATGKKRPTNAAGSERRSLGSSFADLDGEERLEAAKTAVRAAIHASGER